MEIEGKLSLKQNALEKMAAQILAQIDFEKTATTVFIRNIGDCSRYHETVVLKYDRQEWSLLEDYLTPEYSFHREVKLPFLDNANVVEWVKTLLLQNEVLLNERNSCPMKGLTLPNEIRCPE